MEKSNNVTTEEKLCLTCEKKYLPGSNRQLRCNSCRDAHNSSRNKVTQHLAHVRRYVRKGYTLKGPEHPNYRTGEHTYRQFKKDFCEFCDKVATKRRSLCVHHIDENRKNNHIDNLATLCRSCHILVHGFVDNRGSNGQFRKMEVK